MKGSIEIDAFVDYLRSQNLVIAPAHMVLETVKVERLRDKLLRRKFMTFSEISKSELWGKISRTRVYQIAMEHAREDEIIGDTQKKILTMAVVRIAKQRSTL